MSALAKLITCIVAPSRSGWEATWASDGRTPKDFSDESLSGLVNQASSQIAAMYMGKSQAAEAELQFAIYPWEGDPGEYILDISGSAGHLDAKDIQGSGISFGAQSLDALVSDGERYVPDKSKAMFRWIRRVADLQPV